MLAVSPGADRPAFGSGIRQALRRAFLLEAASRSEKGSAKSALERARSAELFDLLPEASLIEGRAIRTVLRQRGEFA